MESHIRRWCAAGALAAAVLGPAMAVGATPADSEQALRARVMKLAADMRCVVCQNQSLADSDAGLAVDLRGEIATMLQQGKSEREVTDFMSQRYGDFVLYSPPMRPLTWLLWLGPGLIMLLGVALLYRHADGSGSARQAMGAGREEGEA